MIRRILAWVFLAIAAILTGAITYVALYVYTPPAHVEYIYQDRPLVSEYPVSMELHSQVGQVSISHKVVYDFDKQIYVYHYKLKNEGSIDVLFNWDVLDRLRGESAFLELNSDKEELITIESRERPTVYNGMVEFMVHEGNVWWPQPAEKHAGPLPISMAEHPIPRSENLPN